MDTEEVEIGFEQLVGLYGKASNTKLAAKARTHMQKNIARAGFEDEVRAVVVAGKGGYWYLSGGIARGDFAPRNTIVITTRDLNTLDRNGSITKPLDLDPEPTMRFDDLLGEARSVFDGVPSSRDWMHLVDTVDACCEQDLDRLLDYIEPQLAKWDAMEMPAWEPLENHSGVRFINPKWHDEAFEGELRCAPPRWIFEMCVGKYYKKHRLIRALHLEHLNINWGVMKKIMANPYMKHLTAFSVGDNPVVGTKTFYKKLRSSEMMRGVKRLRLYSLTTTFDEIVVGLDNKEHSFDSLEELVVRSNGVSYAGEDNKSLEEYPCFASARIEREDTGAYTFEYIS